MNHGRCVKSIDDIYVVVGYEQRVGQGFTCRTDQKSISSTRRFDLIVIQIAIYL